MTWLPITVKILSIGGNCWIDLEPEHSAPTCKSLEKSGVAKIQFSFSCLVWSSGHTKSAT